MEKIRVELKSQTIESRNFHRNCRNSLAKEVGLVLVEALPLRPRLVDEVLHLDQDARVEPRGVLALVLDDERAGLLVRLRQLAEAMKTLSVPT